MPDSPIYDDFSATELSPSLWNHNAVPAESALEVSGGLLLMRGQASAGAAGVGIYATTSLSTLKPIVAEAKLKLDLQRHGLGFVDIALRINLPQNPWWTQCSIGTGGLYRCEIYQWISNSPISEFGTEPIHVTLGQWHLARIEWDPQSLSFQYYLDGKEIGTTVPNEAASLKNAQLEFDIGLWASQGAALSGAADDVRLGP